MHARRIHIGSAWAWVLAKGSGADLSPCWSGYSSPSTRKSIGRERSLLAAFGEANESLATKGCRCRTSARHSECHSSGSSS